MSDTEFLPPQVQLAQMLFAQMPARLLYVAAKLKLADHLSHGPRTAEELAPLTGTDVTSLYRFLRTTSSMGVFHEDEHKRFSLMPLGETLKSGTPGYGATLTMGGDFFSHSFDHLVECVQTGENGFQKGFGVPVFEWLSTRPEAASHFSDLMVVFHGNEPPAVAEAYDFSIFETIADVGGATGNLLTAILGRYPGPHGILFDRPYVVADAPALIAHRGLTDRVSIAEGNFFDGVPEGADAYILSHIIHDWSERQCLTILGNVRRAMKPESRLLLVEMVLPDGNIPHPGKMLDMAMLAFTEGGRERTATEYGELFAKAGLRLTRVLPTESPVSVVEAVPC